MSDDDAGPSDAPGKPPRRRVTGVDLVALVLALTLAMGVALIIVVAIINVLTHKIPVQALGENTTQLLNSALGGITGIIGSYIGFRGRRRGRGGDDNEPDPPPPAG